MTPDMETAAALPQVLQFFAVEILLPGENPIRLLDGASGGITIEGNVFIGRSSEWGTWTAPASLRNGVAESAEHVQLSLHPPSVDAGVVLCGPTVQGAAVSIWRGILNPATGLPVPDPELKWIGVVDVPMLVMGAAGVTVTYDCASAEEAYFEQDEGLGLNDASHQAIHPGELAFAFATAMGEKIYWNSLKPSETTPAALKGSGASATNRLARW